VVARAVKPAEPRFISAFLFFSGRFFPICNQTEPANLCLFLGLVEFSGFGEDLDDTIGKAIQKAARRIVGNVAAVHLQNVLARPLGVAQEQRCGADTRVCRVESRLDAFRTRSETPRRQTAVA
jgi:hypothetical protein